MIHARRAGGRSEIVKQPIPSRPETSEASHGIARITTLLAVGLLVAATLVLFWPTLFGGRTLFGRDITPFFYPMKHVLVESVRSGRIPFWNPGVVGGEPFFASLQPGVLYPGSLLLYVLPLSVSFDWLVALHYPLAGIGLYLLLGRWGRSPAASWVGAAAFMLGGYLVSIGNFPNNLQTVAWVPWLFWAWDRVLERPTSSRVGAFAGLSAVAFLGGEPQMLGLALVWILAHGLLRIERHPAGTIRQLSAFALGGAVALALVSVQLVPFVEYMLSSVRTMSVGLDYASSRSLELAGSAHFVMPPVLAAGVHDFTTRFLAATEVPWILSPYPGAVAGSLALVALGVAGRRRAVFWVGSAMLGVLLAAGSNGLLYRLLFDSVPAFRAFRYPEKFLLLPALAIPILAAWGADAAIRGDRRSRIVGVLGGAAIVYGVLGLVLGLAPETLVPACDGMLSGARLCSEPLVSARLYAATAGRISMLVALAAGAVAVGGRGRLRPEAVVGLLGMLVAADLIAAHAHVNPSVEKRIYEEPTWPARVLAELGADPEEYRYRGSPLQAGMGSIVTVPGALELSNLYLDFQTMGPNVGQLYGFLHQDGLQGVELLSVAMTNDAAINRWADDPVRFLRAMNVRWYADPTTAADSLEGLLLLARHPELPLRLFEVPGPLPRAYLAAEWEVAPNAGRALLRTLEPDFPLGERVVLEESPGTAISGGSGRILAVEYDQNRIRLDARTDGPMVLVVNDRHYPGWTARVNGHRVPVLRASGIFRAVALPAGDSVVEMKFRPTGLVPGTLLSLLGLAFIAGLLILPVDSDSLGLEPDLADHP